MTFAITGEVKTPGTYTYRHESMTIRQAIAEAGGLTVCGSLRRVKIRRVVDGKDVEVDVNISDRFLPNDTIVVARVIGVARCS